MRKLMKEVFLKALSSCVVVFSVNGEDLIPFANEKESGIIVVTRVSFWICRRCRTLEIYCIFRLNIIYFSLVFSVFFLQYSSTLQ